MKNRYLALAFILGVALMFLTGCAAQQTGPEDTEEPVKKVVSKPKTEPKQVETRPAEPEEEEEEPEPVQTKTMDKKMTALLDKHKGRVSSMSYMYQDQTIKPEEWKTWIKGDRMHVELREMDNIKEDVYIDNIYIDLSSNKAEGYCERNVYRCADPNSPVSVKYAKYYKKTPLQWIQDVTYAEKLAEEQMSMRTVWKVRYEEDGGTVTMWIDDYYGLPMKVVVKKGGITNEYIYEDISFNSVDDEDVEHRLITQTYN
ncbi:hypothetical protein ACFL3V_06050 [Nanoarchaeota archaeon]